MDGQSSYTVGSMIAAALSFALLAPSGAYLVVGGTVIDGSGSKPYVADIRIASGRIAAIGKLNARAGETTIAAQGLVVSPGFIDAHSHADSRLADDPSAESQIRQGITTAIVGQDGGGATPISQLFGKIARLKPTLNFAAFAGHGAIRRKVLKDDYKRLATPDELRTMRALLGEDMNAGAVGLSSGLEYDPGYYSDTDELVSLCKVVAAFKGMYISHVRDEGNGALRSLQELIEIAKRARVPAQICHTKLGTASVWGKAAEAIRLVNAARRNGIDITADIYPYRFWQSTITVLTLEKNYEDRGVWERALKDVGGPQNVLLSTYSPKAAWQGKTIDQIAKREKRDAIDIIQEIVRETTKPKTGTESIVCTAMQEADIEAFMKAPWVMFGSDGNIGGSHPRGAGAFPRVLAEYVRKRKVLSLESAISKMTSLPAKRFWLSDRGVLRVGAIADVVVFDPKKIQDKATPSRPKEMSVGARDVFVNGKPALLQGKMTGIRSGAILRMQQDDKGRRAVIAR